MNKYEVISSPKRKRGIPGSLVLVLVFIIAFAAAGANIELRRSVEENESAVVLLLRFEGLAYQLSAFEWESISEGQISSEIVEGVQSTRDEMEQIMGELEQLYPNSENLRLVRQFYATYNSAITEEFKLITAGDLNQARLVDEQQVDPAFVVFIQALTSDRDAYSAKANQVENINSFGSLLVLSFTVAAITLLLLRFQKAQTAIEEAAAEQKALARHQEDFRLLNEMGNELRICPTVAESYTVIANYAQRLFPNVSGALYIINTVDGIFETVITWGETPPELPGRGLSPDKCLALRQGQIYTSEDSTSHGGLCPYLGQPKPEDYLCVPMLAQGKTLGILHLRRSKSLQTSELQSADAMVVLKRELSETVAEHIALAIANLKLQETLQYQVVRDPLTSLFNRRYMEETFKRELDRAARRKMDIGIMMLDIDNFKHFNDTFGHMAGDAVLIKLSSLLRAFVRGEDISCRYGGEEFLLILPEASLQNTHQRAGQLKNEIQCMSVNYQDQLLSGITVSIGIACFPEHGDTIESLLFAADSALYRAKNEGRNRLAIA
ncbi:MAG: sensor domain-containing diguanylate cyclase [Chloroflexi bacterium]|nr:sensor domain-containing diguanylate cyclase [Chloroflexota bacterium]